jgi:hypothetical protein
MNRYEIMDLLREQRGGILVILRKAFFGMCFLTLLPAGFSRT